MMHPRPAGTVRVAMYACLMVACQADPDAREPDSPDAASPTAAPPPSAPLTTPAFCARPAEDAVRDVFCGATPPAIRSLQDLRTALQIMPPLAADEVPTPATLQSADGFVAVLSHSTALSGRLVTPINPRVIMMGTQTVMAFQRGVQQIELISFPPDRSGLNFYLVSFTQACNRTTAGCSSGDLYTPRVEADWEDVTIRDDEELENTPSDCRQCHSRTDDPPRLLMRELQSPWTHFMFPVGLTEFMPGVNGSDLMQDYLNAKGDELYGGLALHTISPETVFRLEVMVGPAQPLLFDAPIIQDERWPYGPDGYATEPQPSPTWERGYEAFKRGEQLALPYLDTRAVDPEKQAHVSAAYQRYLAEEIDPDELPDLGDIFPDDPHLRARIGLETQPDATPVDALIQACGSCHNDVLDQTLSRARFNIDLARMDRAEIEAAIDRIERPAGAPGAMPPPEARQLAPGVRERLVDYLRQNAESPSGDPRLTHAAELGMAGGAKP